MSSQKKLMIKCFIKEDGLKIGTAWRNRVYNLDNLLINLRAYFNQMYAIKTAITR